MILDKPFIGIGAPDPYNPHNIIPVCTWLAEPGTLYVLKPKMNVWRVAQRAAKSGDIIDTSLLSTAVKATFNIARPPRDLFYKDSNTFIKGPSDLEEVEVQELEEGQGGDSSTDVVLA
jgi:hypothetical protein